MPNPMLDSEEEQEDDNQRNRPRSRSPVNRGRNHEDSSDSELDVENMSPQSKKFVILMSKVAKKEFAKQAAPLKRTVNKCLDVVTQVGFQRNYATFIVYLICHQGRRVRWHY